MDYYGKNDDHRNRNRQRDSNYSSSYTGDMDRYQSHEKPHYNRSSSSSSHRHQRSRSPRDRSRSKPKTQQFYDSSQVANRSSNHSHSQRYNRNEESSNGNSSGNHNHYSNVGNSGGYNGHDQQRQPNSGQPSRTIMLRQLPFELDDTEIRVELNMHRVPFKELRLVKNRETGQSRGFAFVEFNTVDEAQRWMNSTQGCITFQNYDNRVQMFYSSPKDDQNSHRDDDWECSKCGIRNFKRRDRCFKCNITREESERRSGGEGYAYTGSNPCNTLILRGLDALTNEVNLLAAVNTLTNFCLQVQNCYIARDPFTHVSRGFSFIEMSSIQEATSLLDILTSNLEVDGKQLVINFSKNTFQTALTQLNVENKLDIQPHAEQPRPGGYNQNTYNNYNANSNAGSRSHQGDQTNSAAALAQAAMASMQKKQELITHLTNQMKQEWKGQETIGSANSNVNNTVESNLALVAQARVYSTPDPSKFVYDKTSGFYYDYSTGFYYDATSQYYFNSTTQQYMYWDAASLTYIPVDQSGQQAAEATAETLAEKAITPEPVAIEKQKTVTKTAAQIAKDMEKWAKSQNTKKSSIVVNVKKPVAGVVAAKKQQAAFVSVPIQQSVPEDTQVVDDSPSPEKPDIQSEPLKQTNYDNAEKIAPALSNSRQATGSSDDLEEPKIASPTAVSPRVQSLEAALKSMIDTNKLACFLCKRQFDSLEILNKHIAKSDLHKKNLEKYKIENNFVEMSGEDEDKSDQNESDSLMAALKYRDRANERRIKHKSPEPSDKHSKKHKKPRENRLKRDHEADDQRPHQIVDPSISLLENTGSVASKMMRKMGWNEGGGIGKNLQGISAPIEATMRQKGAGIGASGVYDMDPNDTYSVAVRKSARARYESIN